MGGCGKEGTFVLPDTSKLGSGMETGSESACIAMSSSVNKSWDNAGSSETLSVSADVFSRFRMWS